MDSHHESEMETEDGVPIERFDAEVGSSKKKIIVHPNLEADDFEPVVVLERIEDVLDQVKIWVCRKCDLRYKHYTSYMKHMEREHPAGIHWEEEEQDSHEDDDEVQSDYSSGRPSRTRRRIKKEDDADFEPADSDEDYDFNSPVKNERSFTRRSNGMEDILPDTVDKPRSGRKSASVTFMKGKDKGKSRILPISDLTCFDCDPNEVFDTLLELEAHAESSHECLIKCDDCERKFCSLHTFELHLKFIHALTLIPLQQPDDLSDVAESDDDDKIRLRRRNKLDLALPGIRCPCCSFIYKNNHYLAGHLLRRHEDDISDDEKLEELKTLWKSRPMYRTTNYYRHNNLFKPSTKRTPRIKVDETPEERETRREKQRQCRLEREQQFKEWEEKQVELIESGTARRASIKCRQTLHKIASILGSRKPEENEVEEVKLFSDEDFLGEDQEESPDEYFSDHEFGRSVGRKSKPKSSGKKTGRSRGRPPIYNPKVNNRMSEKRKQFKGVTLKIPKFIQKIVHQVKQKETGIKKARKRGYTTLGIPDDCRRCGKHFEDDNDLVRHLRYDHFERERNLVKKVESAEHLGVELGTSVEPQVEEKVPANHQEVPVQDHDEENGDDFATEVGKLKQKLKFAAVEVSDLNVEEVALKIQEEMTRRKKEKDRRRGGEYVMKFECDICFKRLKNDQSMSMHRMKEHEEETWIDGQLIPALTDRQLSHHSAKDREKITCEVCGLVLAGMSGFIAHQLAVHKREDLPYPCDQCHRRYIGANKLLNHRRQVHPVSDIPIYMCEYCAKGFNQKRSFDKHIRIHQDFRYQCPDCDSSFRSASSRLEHKYRVHEKIMRYQCEFCGRRFWQKGNMRKHIKLKHQDGIVHHDLFQENSKKDWTTEGSKPINTTGLKRKRRTVKKQTEGEASVAQEDSDLGGSFAAPSSAAELFLGLDKPKKQRQKKVSRTTIDFEGAAVEALKRRKEPSSGTKKIPDKNKANDGQTVKKRMSKKAFKAQQEAESQAEAVQEAELYDDSNSTVYTTNAEVIDFSQIHDPLSAACSIVIDQQQHPNYGTVYQLQTTSQPNHTVSTSFQNHHNYRLTASHGHNTRHFSQQQPQLYQQVQYQPQVTPVPATVSFPGLGYQQHQMLSTLHSSSVALAAAQSQLQAGHRQGTSISGECKLCGEHFNDVKSHYLDFHRIPMERVRNLLS